MVPSPPFGLLLAVVLVGWLCGVVCSLALEGRCCTFSAFPGVPVPSPSPANLTPQSRCAGFCMSRPFASASAVDLLRLLGAAYGRPCRVPGA